MKLFFREPLLDHAIFVQSIVWRGGSGCSVKKEEMALLFTSVLSRHYSVEGQYSILGLHHFMVD